MEHCNYSHYNVLPYGSTIRLIGSTIRLIGSTTRGVVEDVAAKVMVSDPAIDLLDGGGVCTRGA